MIPPSLSFHPVLLCPHLRPSSPGMNLCHRPSQSEDVNHLATVIGSGLDTWPKLAQSEDSLPPLDAETIVETPFLELRAGVFCRHVESEAQTEGSWEPEGVKDPGGVFEYPDPPVMEDRTTLDILFYFYKSWMPRPPLFFSLANLSLIHLWFWEGVLRQGKKDEGLRLRPVVFKPGFIIVKHWCLTTDSDLIGLRCGPDIQIFLNSQDVQPKLRITDTGKVLLKV